jgi:hypothetical protein
VPASTATAALSILAFFRSELLGGGGYCQYQQ